MSAEPINYTFKIKRIGDSRYLTAEVRNTSNSTISVQIYFKRCKSNGVISGKYQIGISNIEPGERMEGSHDLYWILNDWNYAEVTGIGICNGAVFQKASANIPANYRVDKGLCFVATACLGEADNTVTILREWRDNSLRKRIWGRIFIEVYDKVGPILARFVSSYDPARRTAGYLIRSFAASFIERGD